MLKKQNRYGKIVNTGCANAHIGMMRLQALGTERTRNQHSNKREENL